MRADMPDFACKWYTASMIQPLAERYAYLPDLARDPAASPQDIQTGAWRVISDVLQKVASPDTEAAVPFAKRLLGRNAVNQELRDARDVHWLDARLTTAAWGIVETLARGESLDPVQLGNDRYAPHPAKSGTARKVIDVISDFTKGSNTVSQLDDLVRQKTHEALVLGLANRRSEADIAAFPAPASVQDADYREGLMTHYHLYGIRSQARLIPITVCESHVTGAGEHWGTLVVPVGELAIISSLRLKNVNNAAKHSDMERRPYLTDRLIKAYCKPRSEASQEDIKIVGNAISRLYRGVKEYREGFKTVIRRNPKAKPENSNEQ